MSHNTSFPSLRKRVSQIRTFPSLKKVVFFSSIILLSLLYPAYRFQAHADQKPMPKEYSGHNDHRISLQDAAALTRNFRHAKGIDQNTILGEYFDKDALLSALNQEKCTGLRIYYGKRSDGIPVLVLVGVDQSGSDMISGVTLEYGIFCPPFCGDGNPLTKDDIAISELTESASAH